MDTLEGYRHPDGLGIEHLADSLEKPLLDNREYRVIRLPNALEALLIHDIDTDKASAAMDVDVGSFSDPEDMPGMAHAVEHLLFMGTEKYPGENEYNAYLTKYGGMSNAFTASTSTNYYFELAASAKPSSPGASANNSKEDLGVRSDKSSAPLYGALDRFSQFFFRPLFSPDTLDRELRAVDSENKKNLQSDMWRLHQLNKTLSSPNHPYHKFSTGNYKVLHDDPVQRGVKIRDAFINFYETHYSANRMKLVVLGRESLEQLQEWVTEFFSAIQDKGLPKPRWDGHPIYGSKEICTQVFAKPVMESRILDLYFPYPDEDELYDSKPGRYISHLIGHEGPGSILAHLKALGWANSLSSGASSMCPGAAFFSIDIRLTEDGLKHYKDVIQIVFQYIAMLRDHSPQRWIVDEMGQLAEVEFRFRQKIPASRTTSSLGGIMQKPYPRDRLLSAPSLVKTFDSVSIRRGLSHLRPDNFRFTLVSKELPGEWKLKERWYGTEYRYEKIPSDFLRSLQQAFNSNSTERPPELHLPARNEFVPQRLDVEKKEVLDPLIAPKIIRNEGNVRTWFKKDDRFWVPKATIEVCLRSPLVNMTPLNAVMTSLYKELVEDSLTEYAYDAEIAGLDYSIHNHTQGVDISISGFNDKMPVLLEKVLFAMRDLQIKAERFDIIKERLTRAFRNFEFQEPFRQISTHSRWLISERGWAYHELLEELPAVTANDVQVFFPQVLRQLHIEILVHGNLYKEDALRISDLVDSSLKPKAFPPHQWPTRRSLVLPPGSNFLYQRHLRNTDNVNHCIEYIIFIGDNISRLCRAKLLLFAQIADEPCFDTLRTKEQLGYIVSSQALVLNTISAFRVLIQSERDCLYLESRIDAFLSNLEPYITNMPEDEFEAHKVGIINKRLEKLKNLQQESARFWHHISSEQLDFDLANHDVENIESLTKDDVLDFLRTYFLPSSSKRAKASVHLVAQALPADSTATQSEEENKVSAVRKHSIGADIEIDNGQVVITDVKAFKAGLPLSEGARPVKNITEFEEVEAKL